jgi:hypothetical protein
MPVGIRSHNAAPLASASPHRSFLQRLTSFFVRLFECYTGTGRRYDSTVLGLPVVAVAGIGIRRVMGFTVMSFVLGVALFGAALLIFA